MMQILKKRNVADSDRVRLSQVQAAVQASKSQSDETKKRRNSILLGLFHQYQKLLVFITLYRGVLPKLEVYIKMFQAEEPLLHVQHVKMFQLTREFLILFMQPQEVPKVSVKKLLKVDIGNEEKQLHNHNLYLGQFCFPEMQKARREKSKNPWLMKFLKDVRTGYQLAGKYLLQNLPLQNKTLKLMSSLDPELRVMDTTMTSLESLGDLLPNVISEDNRGKLHDEIRTYVSDSSLHHVYNLYMDRKTNSSSPSSDMSSPRIDTDWWSIITSATSKYHTLTRLIKALLTVFSGPLVEASFNIMDDIITDDRSKMSIENYEACAQIKYTLKSKKTTSTEMKISTSMRRCCNKAHKTYREHLQQKKAEKEQK